MASLVRSQKRSITASEFGSTEVLPTKALGRTACFRALFFSDLPQATKGGQHNAGIGKAPPFFDPQRAPNEGNQVGMRVPAQPRVIGRRPLKRPARECPCEQAVNDQSGRKHVTAR